MDNKMVLSSSRCLIITEVFPNLRAINLCAALKILKLSVLAPDKIEVGHPCPTFPFALCLQTLQFIFLHKSPSPHFISEQKQTANYRFIELALYYSRKQHNSV
jgi:hypothetical protein